MDDQHHPIKRGFWRSLLTQPDGSVDHVHLGLLILTVVGSALCVIRVVHDGDQFDAYGFFLGGGLLWSLGSGAATFRDKFLGAAPIPKGPE